MAQYLCHYQAPRPQKKDEKENDQTEREEKRIVKNELKVWIFFLLDNHKKMRLILCWF